ncbi:MAG: hypothetical protein US53_C0039G0002 [Candidatus Woesebacteria bacterium GW2011_GWA1_37_7]|uniref:Uncharacterized protein n=1 Tax=Candidatus Woesebacteria bacterium GW2011_GWA1_37_7 TaxID=1618545 RepID=A0A0G0HDX8_9BACT|nr:MAG: hypothetical protein US53_C0039G0002 [Candidatus Woesebacteria bacterium GW2011_GWA1_37_7]
MKDIEILKGLSSGKDLDSMFDRADLEGHAYRVADLNHLRSLAGEIGLEDVVDLIPSWGNQEKENIVKRVKDAREKYGVDRFYQRMGMERSHVWMRVIKLDEFGDADMASSGELDLH